MSSILDETFVVSSATRLDRPMDIRRKLRSAGERVRTATTDRDRLIVEATAAGWTRRAIADVVGLSFQRVQQIVERAADDEHE